MTGDPQEPPATPGERDALARDLFERRCGMEHWDEEDYSGARMEANADARFLAGAGWRRATARTEEEDIRVFAEGEQHALDGVYALFGVTHYHELDALAQQVKAAARTPWRESEAVKGMIRDGERRGIFYELPGHVILCDSDVSALCSTVAACSSPPRVTEARPVAWATVDKRGEIVDAYRSPQRAALFDNLRVRPLYFAAPTQAADTERLDWLESLRRKVRDGNTWIEFIGGANVYVWDSTAGVLRPENEKGQYPSARAAIDAARKCHAEWLGAARGAAPSLRSGA